MSLRCSPYPSREEGCPKPFGPVTPNLPEDAFRPAGVRPDADGLGVARILLVEDDAMVRDVVAQMLALNGYPVLLAENGEEACRLAAEHAGEIELLITDVVMPQMNGGELAARLCEHYAGLRVLFMSAYLDTDLAARGLRLDAIALLRKPFSVDALIQHVRHLLAAGHRQERAA